MIRNFFAVVTVQFLMLAAAAHAAQPTKDVLTYHANIERTGNFTVPSLDWQRARTLHKDLSFHAQISGHVYAQPLAWHDAQGHGRLLVATEDNAVYALDAATGMTVWKVMLGKAVPRSDLRCGNIDPLGITGTPVIDPHTQTVYLDAMVLNAKSQKPTHKIFALSLKDGAILPGWPVDVAATLNSAGMRFLARDQNERGALTIVGDKLYVPYSGHWGDCGQFHGWVVGIKLNNPRAMTGWRTRAPGGGIWAPAGISSDGQSLYVATGNTFDTTDWHDGEAVIRLDLTPSFSGSVADFFTPRNWRELDARDVDLGGVAPLLFHLGRANLALALGKDGKAYLLNRRNLGGLGGSILSQQVADAPIRNAPAIYPVGNDIYVAFQGPGNSCPDATGNIDLTVLRIQRGAHTLGTAWCAALDGAGSPIVTTTDGRNEPIVWMLGAEGDNRLYAFRGDTGERLFVSEPLSGLRHFQTLIATQDHLYIAADDTVFAFVFQER